MKIMSMKELRNAQAANLSEGVIKEACGKAFPLELICIKLDGGCRGHYPNGKGYLLPDYVSLTGRLVQVKGREGGFDIQGTLKQTLDHDASRWYRLGHVNKYGLFIYTFHERQLKKLITRLPDLFRETKGRYRVRAGLMKRTADLKELSDSWTLIPADELVELFYSL